MKKVLTILTMLLGVGFTAFPQNDSIPVIHTNYIYDTVRYSYGCYAFNDPNGMIQITYGYEAWNLGCWGNIGYYPNLHGDTVHWIQKYVDCKEIYGVAMNFGLFNNGETNVTSNGLISLIRNNIKYLDVYAVLYVSRENGNMELIDEVLWDTNTPYRFFRYYPPLSSFDLSVPICEMYFNTPHILDSTDTAWVGVELRTNKEIDTGYIYYGGLFSLYTATGNSEYVWKCPYPFTVRENDIDRQWGGFFPITCPKPEEPVEDTVDNGIARVRDLSEEVTVYPNPTRDWVEVRSEGSEVLGVTVYDMRGQVVHREEATRRHGRVSIGALPNGVYMMKVETDRGTAIKKVVKR